MTVHNGARFLPQTLESLSAQTLIQHEVVIVDDGSTDDTPQILAAYCLTDRRLRVFRRDQRSGVANALNFGLARCRSELVARADADDLYMRERLERQAHFLAVNPAVGVLSSSFVRIDEAGATKSVCAALTGSDQISFEMLFANCLLHPGTMFRKRIVEEANGYDPRYWTAQDSELWMRLRARTLMENLPEILVQYRVHEKSLTKTRGTEGERLSLSVPARAQSEYLGIDRSVEEVRANVRLYQAYSPLGIDDVRRGLADLRILFAAARRREPAAVIARFRGKISSALLRQAQFCRASDPRSARELYLRSLRIRPSRLGLNGFVGGVGRQRRSAFR